jgi:hypothetical protein
MDTAAAELGAIRCIDIAALLYAVDFDISVPLLLRFGSRIKNHCATMPVDQHWVTGKSGISKQRKIVGSSPILHRLPFHGWSVRVLNREPVSRSAGTV